jgi:NADPH:quinone reductase-like Zn-dependent oxidoreductase
MNAIVQDRYGNSDVLVLQDIDRPSVGTGEVLIRVEAASAFIGDWHVMTGLPYLGRLAFGVRKPKLRVRGQDVAGHVAAVGEDVERFHVGDEVFGVCDGSFAEYAIARSGRVAAKPASLTFDEAAAVPTTGMTALQGLRDRGNIEAGQRVLILGAAGGVGSFAVQIAKAFGTSVTGVCSTSQVETVRSLGADEVIDYTRDDFADLPPRYDVILDTAGNRTLSHLRRGLAPRGTLVIGGGEGGGKWFGGVDRQLRAMFLSPFVGQRLRTFITKPNSDDLTALKELIDAGKVRPVIGKTFALSDVPAAMRYVEAGHPQGKVLISI